MVLSRHLNQKLWLFEFSMSFLIQFWASRYIMSHHWTSESNGTTIWIFRELSCSIWSILIYYGPELDIWVQSYGHLNLPKASVVKFERLDILWFSGGHPSQKLWSFEFAQSFSFQLRAPWYITRFNRTSESKVIVVLLFLEHPFPISSVSIYCKAQSDIRVKSYSRLIFLRASVFNYERLDILWDTIGHPIQKLLSFEFAQSFCFQLRASRYIMGPNRTSKSKVIVVWICSELQFSISSVSI